MKAKSLQDLKDIKKALFQHFLFSSLPEENLEVLISEMKHYSLGPKQIVFTQGDIGSNFFVLTEGIVEIIVNNVRKGFITKGHGFGELALIHDSERTATIRTVDKVTMWGIGRKVFRKALQLLSQLKFEENLKFLQGCPFFSRLTPLQIESLVAVIVNQSFTDGQKIIVEGDPGDLFYITQSGSVVCTCKGRVIRKLFQGDYFGEQALLYNTLRTATVIAVGNVKLLSLGREMLVSVLGDKLLMVMYRNSLRIAFDKCEILQNFNKDQKEAIIEIVQVTRYSRDQVVIKAGEKKNKKILFVLKGSLISNGAVLDVFDNIGAQCVNCENYEKFEFDFIASSESDIGVVKKSQIEEIIQGKFSEKISQNKVVKIIREVQLFRLLSESKLEQLALLLKIQNLNDGEPVFVQGDPGEKFYIVKHGEVQVVKENLVVRTVGKGDYFGERSIFLKENRTASVYSKGNSTIWVLENCDFLSIIEESIQKQLLKRIILQDDSVLLSNLYISQLLGKGTFGNVFLCATQQTQAFYALKSVSRKKINIHNLQSSLVLERKILLEIDHPFIVKLVKTYKDSERIYFLQEYVQGVGLCEVLRILNLLDSRSARFYASLLILILEHLHQHNIIYRDLKPENLIIDEDGYLKLLDFGTAKIIQGRTYTVVGTPQYMAPEVILGKGYGFSADLWSLGILIFEFVCGGVPFGEHEDEPFEIYKEIVNGTFVYPKFIKPTCREKVIIEQLLRANPAMRGNAEHLKTHKWLSGTNWEELLSKKKMPPYTPKVSDLPQINFSQPNNFFQQITAQELEEQIHTKAKIRPFPPLWDSEF